MFVPQYKNDLLTCSTALSHLPLTTSKSSSLMAQNPALWTFWLATAESCQRPLQEGWASWRQHLS